MRFFISFDLEGMPGVVSWEDYETNFPQYQKIIMECLKAVISGMEEVGDLEKVVICDAHAWGHNIPFPELPPKVFLFRGVPRNLGMVEGIEKGFDGLFFLGYHAKAGEPFSTLDHTYSSQTFYSIKINGQEISESLLNAALAGHFGIPLLFVAGDDKLVAEVKKEINPQITTVITKYSFSRYGALNRPWEEVVGELKEKTKLAIARKEKVKPFNFSSPCRLEMTFLNTAGADLASLIPESRRTSGRVVSYKAKDIIEVNKIIRLSAILGLAAREFYK
ncbi:MAG: M55 family metallopeptidase [candidate division WOR-3 bacterium]